MQATHKERDSRKQKPNNLFLHFLNEHCVVPEHCVTRLDVWSPAGLVKNGSIKSQKKKKEKRMETEVTAQANATRLREEEMKGSSCHLVPYHVVLGQLSPII